ncbi:hypothetical protein M426DRAFT_8981 [Hypoxylon sp. CI-4A]|nr:hypothetical protein M426DRAFT_8981 [Hypoxylon sp. CI-4A]
MNLFRWAYEPIATALNPLTFISEALASFTNITQAFLFISTTASFALIASVLFITPISQLPNGILECVTMYIIVFLLAYFAWAFLIIRLVYIRSHSTHKPANHAPTNEDDTCYDSRRSFASNYREHPRPENVELGNLQAQGQPCSTSAPDLYQSMNKLNSPRWECDQTIKWASTEEQLPKYQYRDGKAPTASRMSGYKQLNLAREPKLNPSPQYPAGNNMPGVHLSTSRITRSSRDDVGRPYISGNIARSGSMSSEDYR